MKEERKGGNGYLAVDEKIVVVEGMLFVGEQVSDHLVGCVFITHGELYSVVQRISAVL